MNTLKLVKQERGPESALEYTPLVTIYADASCLRNGFPDASAGCGAVIIDRNRMELKLVAKYLPGGITNQKAEILACVLALRELRRPCRVEMFSDSMYVIDAMNGKNRMKSNRSFWMQLVQQSYGHHVTWRWVKGHDGFYLQEAADRLARAASATGKDLLPEDLEFLTERLAFDGDQLSIRPFEIEIEKIVDRHRAFSSTSVDNPKFGVKAEPPSAFSY